jgi:hypothetical protein
MPLMFVNTATMEKRRKFAIQREENERLQELSSRVFFQN